MGKVVHFEIPADDLDRAERFYTTVFGWRVQDCGDGDYHLLLTGDADAPGIDGAIATRTGPAGNGAAHAWICTVEVDDITETENAVVAAGGKQIRDRAAIPGIGLGTYFTDTEGNLFQRAAKRAAVTPRPGAVGDTPPSVPHTPGPWALAAAPERRVP